MNMQAHSPDSSSNSSSNIHHHHQREQLILSAREETPSSPASIHSDSFSSSNSSSYSPFSSSSIQSPPNYLLQESAPLPYDNRLQRIFDQTLLNAKVEEVSEFLHRYSELIDINAYDEDGQTPLQRSVQSGALPLVKLLIRYGANPGMTNREGWSPVHMASFSGNTELYSYIVRCNSGSLKR